MTQTVFNTNPLTAKERYMFFGEQPNIARYDVLAQPIFYKLDKKQVSYIWTPEEVDLNKDKNDFKTLSDTERHVWIKNISYQSVLDTVQARSPALALLPFVTLPELEACITSWCFFEKIHNDSYNYIIRNAYEVAGDLFDSIVLDDSIMARAKTTIVYYDDFLNAGIAYRAGHPTCTMRELKKKLLLCIASINALEGLSFYSSFACSFAFAEQGLMEGNAKIITFIAKDESLHLAITQNILKKWENGEDDPEMKKLYKECLPEIEKIYNNIIEQEKEWCKYLFKDGPMLGLNEKILTEYVEFMAGKRMKNLGIKTSYTTKNPLSWTEKYLTSGDIQVAPQETEITSYVIGGTKNDLSDANFKKWLT
jgi:ribonucleoside-diphosphate reductase beta chain